MSQSGGLRDLNVHERGREKIARHIPEGVKDRGGSGEERIGEGQRGIKAIFVEKIEKSRRGVRSYSLTRFIGDLRRSNKSKDSWEWTWNKALNTRRLFQQHSRKGQNELRLKG